MRLNELTISTFKSDYLKKYLTDIKHVFTLEEMVTILINSKFSLSTKINILNRFFDQEEVSGYTCDDYNELLKNISEIISDIDYIIQCLNGKHNSIITFVDNYGSTYCSLLFDNVRNIIKEEDYNVTSINIVNGITSKIEAYVDVDKILNPINLHLLNKDNNKLYERYVNIPNDLCVGDIVYIHDKKDEEFIVVNDSSIPDKFINDAEYNIDASITVVPKYVLDDSKDYKQQIDEILAKRIKDVDNENDYSDIIFIEHEHFHLSVVERSLVDDNM